MIDNQDIIPWKRYTTTFGEVGIAFCLATFSMALFFSHFIASTSTIIFAIVLGLLYITVIIICIKRLIDNLSIAALMLLVPIAPLAVLLLVISLLPLIQKLQ